MTIISIYIIKICGILILAVIDDFELINVELFVSIHVILFESLVDNLVGDMSLLTSGSDKSEQINSRKSKFTVNILYAPQFAARNAATFVLVKVGE